MKAVIQRVKKSSVKVDDIVIANINNGLNVLIAITHDDDSSDIKWLANKIINLRIFNDENHKMNKSILDINGELLIISQFTLYGNTRKGNRPSFAKSAGYELGESLYKEFIKYIKDNNNIVVAEGEFGGDMEVEIINDGPVTLIVDSKE